MAGVLLAFALVAGACGGDGEVAPPQTIIVTETSIVTEVVTETSIVTETEIVEVEAENPFEGTTVTVFGPESSDVEAGAHQAAMDVFAAETGIDIQYTGARDFSDLINS